MFNRIEAKMQAKASMRQTSPSPILVTLVYLLLTAGLVWLLNLVLFDPVSIVMDDLLAGYTLEESLSYLIWEYGTGLTAVGVVQLLIAIYRTIMGFGYRSYALRLARNERPSFSNLFDGFAKFLRVLWMNILIGIFTSLWTFIFVVPAVILVVVAVVIQENPYFVLGVYSLAVIAAVAAMLIVRLRYRLAEYFLLDDPSCTAREAIRRSKRAMKGWKMELFILDLSFIGWELLGSITMGILFVWVLPYLSATEANFYDCVTGGMYPSGDPVGPDYRAPGDPPLPF